jgi:hypothetical protein
MVNADKGTTEKLSNVLSDALRSIGLDIVQLTPDYDDRYEPKERAKFHITAIPAEVRGKFVLGAKQEVGHARN